MACIAKRWDIIPSYSLRNPTDNCVSNIQLRKGRKIVWKLSRSLTVRYMSVQLELSCISLDKILSAKQINGWKDESSLAV